MPDFGFRATARPGHRPALITAALAGALAAQGCAERAVPSPSVPSDGSAVAVQGITATASFTSPPAQAATPPAPDASALTAPGPFLIHRSPAPDATSDLVVRHPHGALAAEWRLPSGGRVGRLRDALSPDGRWLAFLTGDAPDFHLTAPMTTPLTLRVWDLAAGREAFAHTLVREDIYGPLRAQALGIVAEHPVPSRKRDVVGTSTPEPWMITFTTEDVVSALTTGLGQVAWSPDGEQLAFVGALDGPSGDVYAADIASWTVRRLSDEPTHVIHLAWSPDSRWILHEGTEYHARAGGVPTGSTTDSVDALGTTRRHVFDGTNIGGGDDDGGWLDAWIGDHEVVLHRSANGCGVCNIVRVDVSTGVSRTVVARMESSGFVVSLTAGRIAIGGKGDGAGSGIDAVPGVHVIDLDGHEIERLADDMCTVAAWGTEAMPFAWLPNPWPPGNCEATAFGPGGTVALEPPGDQPGVRVSPHGTWRALYSQSGVFVYDAESVVRSRWDQAGADHVNWRPDEAGLFWETGDQLWYADVPSGTPRSVGMLPADWWNWFDVGWLLRDGNPS